MARIMMWANYRRAYNISVPCPSDGRDDPWWYDVIAANANGWANWAKTDVLFPQPLKTNAGSFPGADGYGVYDDYDIGSKPTTQFGAYGGGVPTRFGYADQLRRAAAICHANGLNVLCDHVMHQRMGGSNGTYMYGASGGRNLGRFPKQPPCFRGNPPRVPEDPVPSPKDDFAFGDQLCPINGKPQGYVANGLIDAGDWLWRTVGYDGARLDDMKGMNAGFVKRFVTSKAMKGKWFFGEFASGGTYSWTGFGGGIGVWNWIHEYVDGLCSATDFDFHYNMVMPMCNGGGSFFMGNLARRGLIYADPMHASPFVESMDSDTNGFATVVFNKILGYALMLMGEGLPQIYYRDWASQPACYGLHRDIDNLCWIAHHFGNGSTIPRLTHDPHIYVFERSAPPGLLVALNNDVWNPDWHTVNVQTNFGPHRQLHDYTGHNQQSCWTDGNGRVTFGVPPANNGQGYGCWAPAGFQGHQVKRGEARFATQEFFGADDLDIGVLTSAQTKVGRIWCEADKPVSILMKNVNGQDPDFKVWMQIFGPDGSQLVQGHANHVYGDTKERGWHTIIATGQSFQTNQRTPYIVEATYMAPTTLQPAEYGI
jgi:hypothetical protein